MDNQQQNNLENSNMNPQGTATHSGWMYFYTAFAKYRDECIRLCQNVMGNNLNLATSSLSTYHSSIYSMAQQLFGFYDETTEEAITTEWIALGEEVNEYLSLITDAQFRNQMGMEGTISLDAQLKLKLIKFFNKIERMAVESGLLVGQENKGTTEPQKGLLGFIKR